GLTLKGHGSHPAAVGDAPGLHRRSAGRAAWLGVEREEGHTLVRHPVEAGGGHAAARAAAVRASIAVAEVIGQDQDDVGLLLLGFDRAARAHERRERSEYGNQ